MARSRQQASVNCSGRLHEQTRGQVRDVEVTHLRTAQKG
jgi:hypothetical protein